MVPEIKKNMIKREIETRLPVLEKETAKEFDYEAIERQWRLLTEAIKREIKVDPEIRKILSEFSTRPLSETLPQAVLVRVAATNQRVQALISRYSSSLERFISLPAVPDELIVPDIQNASSHKSVSYLISSLEEYYGAGTPEFEKALQRNIELGSFAKGITAEERLLVAMRYRFARDLKTLCLAAELMDHPVTQESNGKEVTLPSGIKIMVDTPYSKYGLELLNPINWENRRQLKDRIYEVRTGDHRYILKERKTPKHLHQKRHGYVEPRTSIEEFNIAKDLNQNGRVEWGGRVEVSWERPIGYVEFPDGFQFVVFEYSSRARSRRPEDEYYDGSELMEILIKQMTENREQFKEEYQKVARLAEEEFVYSPEASGYSGATSEAALLFLTKLIRKQGLRPVSLSFEDFVRVKAKRIFEQARGLLEAGQYGLGYSNNDHDGFACYIPKEDEVKLGIIGFDFEYFSTCKGKPDPKEYIKRVSRFLLMSLNRENHFSLRIGFELMTRMQAAAYFALLHLERRELEKFSATDESEDSTKTDG